MTSFDLNCSIYSRPEFPPSPRRWTTWKISCENSNIAMYFSSFGGLCSLCLFYCWCVFVSPYSFFSVKDWLYWCMILIHRTFHSAKTDKKIFMNYNLSEERHLYFLSTILFLWHWSTFDFDCWRFNKLPKMLFISMCLFCFWREIKKLGIRFWNWLKKT